MPKDILNFLETKFYVKQAGNKAPIYMYYPKGDITFYLGAGVVIDEEEILRDLPEDKRIWYIESDGGYSLEDISLED